MGKKRRVWWIVGGLVLLVGPVTLWLALFLAMATHGVCIDPYPRSATLNGEAVDLSPNGCFSYTASWGTYVLVVEFESGVKREVEFYPSFSDDNSNVVFVTERGVDAFDWDLDYKVVK